MDAMSTYLEMKIEKYDLLNSGLLASEHVYTVRIWCDRTATYAIRRSAAEFVALSQALQKRFAHANVADVPLKEVKVRRPLLVGGAQASRAVSYEVNAADAAGMGAHRGALERWLRDVAAVPEIVGCDEVVLWLGDDGDCDADLRRLVTAVDFALEGATVQRFRVRHGASHDVDVRCAPDASIVVWSFASAPRDVGFSILCDGAERRRYERVPSHQKLVQGACDVGRHADADGDDEADDDDGASFRTSLSTVAGAKRRVRSAGVVTFRWHNEYALWRDKRIFFRAAALTAQQYQHARRRHRERAEQDRERAAHNEALQRSASLLAAWSPNDEDALDGPQTRGEDAGSFMIDGRDVRRISRGDVEAVALEATARAAGLSAALGAAEREASACRAQRDGAVAEKLQLQRSLDAASTRGDTAQAALAAERTRREAADEDARAGNADAARLRRDCADALERLARAQGRTATLERERDLLKQAVAGYRDTAELAHGDAQLVRDELARLQSSAFKGDARAAARDHAADEDDDEEDDLLRRVEALQQTIDSELKSSNPLKSVETARSGPRRHELTVPPGLAAGQDMPFTAEGMALSVAIPAGFRPGDTFTIELR
ncbi:hypothetical protein M885DRAFT_611066 [Pelagophyceae sp. CCMP2097]|nr:hypothetical protein M885DRAFT_611066 [Pelagophyceae sp. CCMP2097]